jgi:hypothetical protein
MLTNFYGFGLGGKNQSEMGVSGHIDFNYYDPLSGPLAKGIGNYGMATAILPLGTDGNASYQRVIVGFNWTLADGSPSQNVFAVLADMSNNPLICLRLEADWTVSIVRGSDNAVLGHASAPLAAYAPTYIEWKVNLATSPAAGDCELRFNGATVLTLPGGTSITSSKATQLRFPWGPIQTSRVANVYVLDWSSDDPPYNHFLGPCVVLDLPPANNGARGEWSPGANNYAAVDDESVDGSDGDATVVTTSAVNKCDLYAVAAPATYAVDRVYGVAAHVAGKKDSGEPLTGVIPLVKVGALPEQASGTGFVFQASAYQSFKAFWIKYLDGKSALVPFQPADLATLQGGFLSTNA